jgi:hypothetical protein
MTCGEALTGQMPLFLAQVNNKVQNKQLKDKIMECCKAMEDSCGPEARKMLKQKVPTYASFF